MPATAHHVGITVSSLEEVLPFYRDVLGLDVITRFSVSGEAFATGVGVENATGSFAHLDGDGTRIELVEYDPEGADIEEPSLNRPGAIHLGLDVDDIDAFYEALPEDVETISEPQTTESGTRICFLRDPEKNLVEVLEQ
ncbi:VOC family protein [Natranaeroarchaeum sulfidigenes]|uniref:Lactoylglutathione lyase or related enzyme n=1 Tax=Natranaeroarchaeum sulfidigenes TaxID=2784880 RepID=A0A897MVP5_9EURY|nr:VOC family protein [Natranaeroarchaeum sulfidigenes]QSG02345.1 Lactoylglutathione lyase or related enzyme [Natranaeroarchaeum sulfidigenes]